jgi:Arc/MetJ family transcription regulator
MARVKRTTINLDLDLLDEASETLGTSRMTETVHAAMADVVRRRKLEALTRMEFPGMTLEKLKEMRRPRNFDHLLD